MDGELITVKELARILRITPRTVYEYVKKNAIPHYRSPSGRIYFNLDAVMRWLQDWTMHYNSRIRRRGLLLKITYGGEGG